MFEFILNVGQKDNLYWLRIFSIRDLHVNSYETVAFEIFVKVSSPSLLIRYMHCIVDPEAKPLSEALSFNRGGFPQCARRRLAMSIFICKDKYLDSFPSLDEGVR